MVRFMVSCHLSSLIFCSRSRSSSSLIERTESCFLAQTVFVRAFSTWGLLIVIFHFYSSGMHREQTRCQRILIAMSTAFIPVQCRATPNCSKQFLPYSGHHQLRHALFMELPVYSVLEFLEITEKGVSSFFFPATSANNEADLARLGRAISSLHFCSLHVSLNTVLHFSIPSGPAPESSFCVLFCLLTCCLRVETVEIGFLLTHT